MIETDSMASITNDTEGSMSNRLDNLIFGHSSNSKEYGTNITGFLPHSAHVFEFLK